MDLKHEPEAMARESRIVEAVHGPECRKAIAGDASSWGSREARPDPLNRGTGSLGQPRILRATAETSGGTSSEAARSLKSPGFIFAMSASEMGWGVVPLRTMARRTW